MITTIHLQSTTALSGVLLEVKKIINPMCIYIYIYIYIYICVCVCVCVCVCMYVCITSVRTSVRL